MDRERWQQIEEAFHRAAALPAGERRAFLDELEAADEELRREVESLLGSGEAADDPVAGTVERALKDVAFEGTAQKDFGPYRVDRWLGGGSQSDVYLAERTDGEYRSRVAVKVAKRGFPTEDLRQRFRQERQILASLRHPHIARILDGGTTEEGLPFFVMELVDGEPIDLYCDRRRLTLTARLELFRDVCSAVEHAHRNLTIHRDLKPGNILVDREGRPVLLDFGIAKLLEDPKTQGEALRTIEGLRFLTPAYASPEQVLGEPLTTSTDVYSLGVVLYELLSGRPPYEVENLEPKALYEAVCERQPPAPSRTLAGTGAELEQDRRIAAARGETVESLRQKLKGDLDTIALMALRKEPERRYPSVAALAEDIERTLAFRPIRARKETLGYRSKKLLRRHPYGVAATVALLLAVLIGVLSTLRATWIARQQRDQARISQAEAERVTDFMVGLFEVSSPEVSLGEKVSALEILDRGADRIAEGLDEQPLTRARLLSAMGRAYHGLGLYGPAEELLARSVADREAALGPDHPEVADALLELAKPVYSTGDYPRTEEIAQRALAIYSNLGPTAELARAWELGRASALDLLAEVRRQQGNIEAAEELFRRSLKIRRARLGPDALETLKSLESVAEVLFARQRPEEAGELFEEVLAGRRRKLSEAHPDVVMTLSNLSVVQQAKGDLAGAETIIRQVVEARRSLYGEAHPHVALTYSNLGQILSFQGEHEEAAQWLEKALALSVQLYGDSHPRVADLEYNLGLVLEELGRLEEAEARLRHSLEVRREILGEEHPSVAQSLVALSFLHRKQGRPEEALEEARHSYRILRTALPEGDYRRSSPALQLGRLLADAGRCPEARPFLDEALALRREVLPEGHPARQEAERAAEPCR